MILSNILPLRNDLTKLQYYHLIYHLIYYLSHSNLGAEFVGFNIY